MSERLSSLPNPHRNKCYIVTIIQELTLGKKVYMCGLRYVPDKLLLEHGQLGDYLNQVASSHAGLSESLAEELTHTILEDIMNRIIPKWIEVNLLQKQNKHGQKIMVTMEDRQPGFENDALRVKMGDIF